MAEARGQDEAAAIGQAAHIVAQAGGGPRGSEPEPLRIHGYDNLILLCAHHHGEIDKQTNTNTVELLRAWKAEHEAWVEAATRPGPAEVPWVALVQQPNRRVDTLEMERALGGANRIREYIELAGEAAGASWEEEAGRQWRQVELAAVQTPPERRRFAVFSTGRIPLAFHLGYALGDRARAEVMHYDRDRGSWAWEPEAKSEGALALRPGEGRGGEANLVVSLSAPVDRADIPRREFDVEIAAPEPSVRWLRERSQLAELSRAFAQALAAIRERRCAWIHLYYAGPAAGAVELGRAYNGKMNPPVQLYEYAHSAQPRYRAVLTLNR